MFHMPNLVIAYLGVRVDEERGRARARLRTLVAPALRSPTSVMDSLVDQ